MPHGHSRGNLHGHIRANLGISLVYNPESFKGIKHVSYNDVNVQGELLDLSLLVTSSYALEAQNRNVSGQKKKVLNIILLKHTNPIIL